MRYLCGEVASVGSVGLFVCDTAVVVVVFKLQFRCIQAASSFRHGGVPEWCCCSYIDVRSSSFTPPPRTQGVEKAKSTVDDVSSKSKDALDKGKDAAGGIKDEAKDVADSVKDAKDTVEEETEGVVGNIKDKAGSAAGAVKDVAGSAASGVKSAAGSAASGVKSAAGSAAGAVKGAADGVAGGVIKVCACTAVYLARRIQSLAAAARHAYGARNMWRRALRIYI